MSDPLKPLPQHKFTFGLWTIANPGRDPFGLEVRSPISSVEIVHLLAETGAYGVNFHDNDLVPIDASQSERDKIVQGFKKALNETGLIVPMATVNLFTDPCFRDGAFTSNDPNVRAYALQKTMRAIDLGVELGAETFVMWGGREGVETDIAKKPQESFQRIRDALNFLCEYVNDREYNLKFALEAKPNEPRGDIYLPTTGSMLALISTLENPEMVGVNPEMAHEHMSGLNFLHAISQAWEMNKLFHIDLNDQNFARFDQDFRFSSHNYKQSFFVVKFLEECGYSGSRHFDAHAYRTEDAEGVKDFAKGCIRSYLVLKEKARLFKEDKKIQELLKNIPSWDPLSPYSPQKAKDLKEKDFNRKELASRCFAYEQLDQLLFELLMGMR